MGLTTKHAKYETSATGAVSLVAGGATVSVAYVIAQTAVPVILAPNGTVATNGTITLGTALSTTYANAWVYLPAGAVVAGLAGLYFATFSSTTVGVITTTYTSVASAFTPYIPTGTVVATGSNAAYTQSTAETTLANITVPGGMMGANGSVACRGTNYSAAATGGNKTVRARLGGSTEWGATIITSSGGVRVIGNITNRGSASSQVSNAYGGLPNYTTTNTAVDQALTFTAQLAVATDYIVLEGFTVEVLPKA